MKKINKYKKRLLVKLCICLIAVTFFAISCEISGLQDENVEKDYTFDTLRLLNIKNDINVILIQDSSDFIRIIAPENIHEGLIPEIKNDTIVITNSNPTKIINRYSQEVKAEVHFTNLSIIFHQGGGSIKSVDTLKMQTLNLWTNGATGKVNINFKGGLLYIGLSTGSLEVVFNGETQNLYVWTTSYAFINLPELKSEKATIQNNSPVDCYIHVNDALYAEAQYTGNIFYKGDPITKEILETNTGKVLKIQ